MLKSQLALEVDPLSNFVGASAAFMESIGLIRRFARSSAPVLLIGETGTGKELAAHALHYLSDRRDGAFIPINCGALPDSLIESELFGHAKGAFTDASQSRLGLIRKAEGGTLFLDEVEALSARGQVVLLRFLQDATFRSIGEERLRHADVRVITASNVNLRRIGQGNGFRPDLLFRLDVLSIEMPPLRDRVEDIALLVPYLLGKAARSEGGHPKSISPAALKLLYTHAWPGNVRELEHVLLRAHLLSASATIETLDLLKCSTALISEHSQVTRIDRQGLRELKLLAVREVERRFVETALSEAGGNISEAARLSNMERATLSKMAKKYQGKAFGSAYAT
jgi:DNA-binding NtrC family response regulator